MLPTAAHSSSHTHPRSRAVALVVWLHRLSRTTPGSESVRNLDIMIRKKSKMHPRHVPCGVKSDAWISPSSKSASSCVLFIHTISFSRERLPHDNAMGHLTNISPSPKPVRGNSTSSPTCTALPMKHGRRGQTDKDSMAW